MRTTIEYTIDTFSKKFFTPTILFSLYTRFFIYFSIALSLEENAVPLREFHLYL